ncbi:hypothetical protein QJS10_CPB19g00373 [Acorus calamus]|uniref:Uncharacterized protein n=1 Tax=Acorus calamus TaxID=4465 RepID=A0AAV9CG63_ACOCL|nr:hypothetical protein QJS10_CPB19g00373 [Acorus calamus]
MEPNYQHDEVDKSVWEPYLEKVMDHVETNQTRKTYSMSNEIHNTSSPRMFGTGISLRLQQIFGDTVAHGGGSRTTNQLDTSAPIEVTNLDGSQSPMHQFGFGDDDMAESVSPKPPHTSDSKRRKS